MPVCVGIGSLRFKHSLRVNPKLVTIIKVQGKKWTEDLNFRALGFKNVFPYSDMLTLRRHSLVIDHVAV